MKLFRGKRIDNGEWVEGSLISFDGGTSAIATSKSKIFFPAGKGIATIDGIWEVDPATVGQYIGKDDSEGNKAFKGDIFYDSDWEDVFVIDWSEEQLAWFANYITGTTEYLYDVWNLTLQKIGNEIDNPELLEV